MEKDSVIFARRYFDGFDRMRQIGVPDSEEDLSLEKRLPPGGSRDHRRLSACHGCNTKKCGEKISSYQFVGLPSFLYKVLLFTFNTAAASW